MRYLCLFVLISLTTQLHADDTCRKAIATWSDKQGMTAPLQTGTYIDYLDHGLAIQSVRDEIATATTKILGEDHTDAILYRLFDVESFRSQLLEYAPHAQIGLQFYFNSEAYRSAMTRIAELQAAQKADWFSTVFTNLTSTQWQRYRQAGDQQVFSRVYEDNAGELLGAVFVDADQADFFLFERDCGAVFQASSYRGAPQPTHEVFVDGEICKVLADDSLQKKAMVYEHRGDSYNQLCASYGGTSTLPDYAESYISGRWCNCTDNQQTTRRIDPRKRSCSGDERGPLSAYEEVESVLSEEIARRQDGSLYWEHYGRGHYQRALDLCETLEGHLTTHLPVDDTEPEDWFY